MNDKMANDIPVIEPKTESEVTRHFDNASTVILRIVSKDAIQNIYVVEYNRNYLAVPARYVEPNDAYKGVVTVKATQLRSFKPIKLKINDVVIKGDDIADVLIRMGFTTVDTINNLDTKTKTRVVNKFAAKITNAIDEVNADGTAQP